jgi:hypothetical protein
MGVGGGFTMIPMYNEPCPLDHSELVLLGGKCARPGKFDVAYYYCPRCDAGFVCWANPARAKPTIFTWRRKGTHLVLAVADVLKVPFYLRHGWLSARSDMLRGVRSFLAERLSMVQGCPEDGGQIPLIAELPCHENSPVRFYWCRYCAELFAYLKDEYYGWQYVASFSHDTVEGYKLRKRFRPSPFAEVIRERVANLPPPSAFPNQ